MSDQLWFIHYAYEVKIHAFGVDSTILWLNQKPIDEHWEAVRKALRKKVFAFGRLNQRLHPLEFDTL